MPNALAGSRFSGRSSMKMHDPGSTLRDVQRKFIDQRVRLERAQVTRGEECAEVPQQIKFTDAIGIQLRGFVIERGQKITARGGQFVEENARFGFLAGLREDELFEADLC